MYLYVGSSVLVNVDVCTLWVTCTCKRVYAHAWRPEADFRCLSSVTFHLYLLRQSFSLNLKFIDWLGWLAKELQGSTYPFSIPLFP